MPSSRFPHTPNLPADEKPIATTDATSTLNARFANGKSANMLFVGGGGDVRLFFEDGTDDSTDADGSRTVVGLVPGIWVARKPFRHVYLSGTTATNIRVGRSF